jgi:iron-sulfur cluster insertion protein
LPFHPVYFITAGFIKKPNRSTIKTGYFTTSQGEKMPKIILTERAVQKVIEIICKQPNPERIQGLRVSVVGGGCAGFSYNIEFASPKALFLPDETLEFEGVKPSGEPFKLKVFIDAASTLYLDGTTIDYVEALVGSGFKFDNPSAKEKCAGGQSFNA